MYVETNVSPTSPLLCTHHCTHCNAFTLTILYAFRFPMLTPRTGIPACLVTTNCKRFYLIVVPRRSIINNVISDECRIFQDSKGNLVFLFICSFEQRYNSKSGQQVHWDAAFFLTSLLGAPHSHYLISLSYNSFSETKGMFSSERERQSMLAIRQSIFNSCTHQWSK